MDQEQIGKRLAGLRTKKGFSQEELSGLVGISRPSLAQIENGNRSVGASELQAFAKHLQFSLDNFFGSVVNESEDQGIYLSKKAKTKKERLSVPTLNVEKFRQVLLYILERCAGKPNVGETVLYKLLYFVEFNYYELYEEHLAGATFKKLPYGPVPQKIDSILKQMEDKDQLRTIKVPYFGKTQKRYIPLQKPDLQLLKASEKDVIDRVIDQLSDFSASAISDYSHKDIPWKATENGEVIDYSLAFYRELPFSVRNFRNNEEKRE